MSAESRRDPLGISGTLLAEKYRIGHAIGEGGFSVVYKAEHTIWQQPVAIKCFKVLSNAPEGQRQELLDSFIQEGKLMAQLSSRSAAIVQARDVGNFITQDGQWIPFMVLEWLEGRPLDRSSGTRSARTCRRAALHEMLSLLEPAAPGARDRPRPRHRPPRHQARQLLRAGRPARPRRPASRCSTSASPR